jgi:hypothetical protein
MQIFDQSRMRWYALVDSTLETALFTCTNPTEFALQVQGIGGTSDRSFEGFQAGKVETAPGGGKAKPVVAPRPSTAKDMGISRDPFKT